MEVAYFDERHEDGNGEPLRPIYQLTSVPLVRRADLNKIPVDLGTTTHWTDAALKQW